MNQSTRNLSTAHYQIEALRAMRPSEGYSGQTGGAFRKYQTQVARRFKELIGWIEPDLRDYEVRRLWHRPHECGTIEKVEIRIAGDVWAPVYVCLPHDTFEPPLPVMICLQGHSTGMHRSIGVEADDETKALESPKPGQDTAIQCMRQGMAAICLEQRAFGERRDPEMPHMQDGKYPNCVTGSIRAMGLGRTLLAERVLDVATVLHFIKEHPALDARRVGTMGNSTGGTVSLVSAALYPDQIHFSMPSCCFYPYGFTFMRAVRCMCAYIPNVVPSLEIEDVAGLIAPRPLVILAGTEDGISYPHVKEAYRRLEPIYQASGGEGQCRFISVEGGGHQFYPEQGWPVLLDLLKENGILT